VKWDPTSMLISARGGHLLRLLLLLSDSFDSIILARAVNHPNRYPNEARAFFPPPPGRSAQGRAAAVTATPLPASSPSRAGTPPLPEETASCEPGCGCHRLNLTVVVLPSSIARPAVFSISPRRHAYGMPALQDRPFQHLGIGPSQDGVA